MSDTRAECAGRRSAVIQQAMYALCHSTDPVCRDLYEKLRAELDEIHELERQERQAA